MTERCGNSYSHGFNVKKSTAPTGTKSRRRTMADCPNCEYHKDRAARWRAEAYKQAGHDIIELPWVGLTDEEMQALWDRYAHMEMMRAIEAKLKEKNT